MKCLFILVLLFTSSQTRAATIMGAINLYGVRLTYGAAPWIKNPETALKEVKPYTKQDRNNYLLELIPADETFENWKTIFAVTALKYKTSVPLKNFEEYALQGLTSSCENIELKHIVQKDNASIIRVLCPSMKPGITQNGYSEDMGEVALFTLVVHDNILISNYVEWRGKKFDKNKKKKWPVSQKMYKKALSDMKNIRTVKDGKSIRLSN